MVHFSSGKHNFSIILEIHYLYLNQQYTVSINTTIYLFPKFKIQSWTRSIVIWYLKIYEFFTDNSTWCYQGYRHTQYACCVPFSKKCLDSLQIHLIVSEILRCPKTQRWRAHNWNHPLEDVGVRGAKDKPQPMPAILSACSFFGQDTKQTCC